MANDLFRKGKSLFATTLVQAIDTGTGETIELNSATGLPTDTEITLTFNRVNTSEEEQPVSEIERITGTISGVYLISYTRGQDGTVEQAHGASTVVEYIPNAEDQNDLVDGILVGHDQDGGHATSAIDAITEIATGIKSGSDSTLITGTKGTTDYTAKWNADGDLVDGYAVLDEDDMVSDSSVSLATQQSVKAYVDSAKTIGINFLIDGGGSAISTGIKGDLRVPFACTITSVDMLANASGSIVVDIWKDTYANFPPTVADTIVASAKPTISSATKSTDSTLTGWTKTVSAGDILRFNVDSCTTIARCTLVLNVTRS
jgi:hypothetical protein